MISLKRAIETEATSATLLRALAEAYQGTLGTMAESAAQASPAPDPELQPRLAELGKQMATAETTDAIGATGARVSARLQEWADGAEADLRRKAADVKELLVTLAQTASSVAASDAEHVMRFDALTARLEKIATLDDVRELRTAVMSSARELRDSVEALSSSRARLKQMQTELTTYQTKLEAAEKMAAVDPLTGLMNRRRMDATIDKKIQRAKPFAIGLIDLDGFKAINDHLGHLAGDDLLRQFSADLKANARAGDIVGRWGGDEFVVIVDGSGDEARTHFKRIQAWVGGSYTLDGPQGKAKVQIDLSIGVAEWRTGMTASELIEEADRRMYANKRSRR
jgi:diguanylate cyclase (GGDEF)-like protein